MQNSGNARRAEDFLFAHVFLLALPFGEFKVFCCGSAHYFDSAMVTSAQRC
jgi:hypothetical protein